MLRYEDHEVLFNLMVHELFVKRKFKESTEKRVFKLKK